MKDYQKAFIEFALAQQALSFGEFTLKSGRISPYFFNAGAFKTGKALAKLGEFYAQAIHQSSLDFDVLYGPAYKGIPLACACTIAFANTFQKDIPYAFNRKEVKSYGEGGLIVGTDIRNKRVFIIDDVISAGTAIRESVEIIKNLNATLVGIIIALDRQERGKTEQSAIQEIAQEFGVPIIHIITLDHLMTYVKVDPNLSSHVAAIENYKSQFGCARGKPSS